MVASGPSEPHDFDLAKQLRIAARNRLVSKNLTRRAELRQRNLIGVAAIVCIIVFTAIIATVFGMLK